MDRLRSLFSKPAPQEKKSDFKIEDDDEDDDSGLVQSLQINLSRLIVYAESADVQLQREVKFIYFSVAYSLHLLSHSLS